MKWILIIYSVVVTIRLIAYKASVEGLCKYMADNYDVDDINQEDLEECTREAIRRWFRKWGKIMEKTKSLNLNIKVKGLDEFKEKLDLLENEFEMLDTSIGNIKKLIDEINQMELIVDVDRDKADSWLFLDQLSNVKRK